jgi:aspartate/methionine/tyrosine aminotransferase
MMNKNDKPDVSPAPDNQAARIREIEPFYVMEILERAFALERSGRSVIHLEVGEPDFPTPAPVVEAGMQALREGRTRYVQALGIDALRERIAARYPSAGRPPPGRVAVTPGSSGAFQLIFGSLINAGDEVLLTDPGYPCNANFVRLYEGIPRLVACDAAVGYQFTAKAIETAWTERTKAVLIGTPSNPTGTAVPPDEMTRIVATVERLGGTLIVDEIYHGLTYGSDVRTALCDTDRAFIVNSFSKYFGMTGWRVGWLVMPSAFIDGVTKLAQNLFISTSTPAQYAALRAFEEDVVAELDRRRDVFRQRRDYLVPALRELGFKVPVTPEGAFYVYADCSAFTDDSYAFALDVLESTGVAITPGKDFGRHRQHEHVRFSYANTQLNLERGVERLTQFLRNR